jgi:hypothetical protein
MFCTPGHVFGDADRVGSRFHILRAGLIFGDPEGVSSHFHILRARTRFRRYRERQLPFSCFALPDSFSAVLSALGPIFMFCALRFVFGCT